MIPPPARTESASEDRAARGRSADVEVPWCDNHKINDSVTPDNTIYSPSATMTGARVSGNHSLANTTDHSSTLEALKDAELVRLIPVIVYLVFLSMSGTIGNAIVFHVYRKQYRASNSKYFVLFLCVLDLFSCVVAMPLEVATVLDQYTFDNVWLCKTSRFCNYIATMSSSWLIGLISVERYRKVCKPFQWQISVKVGNILCITCIVLGTLSSIPAIPLYGKKSNYIPHYDVIGTECSIDDSMSESALAPFHVVLSAGLFAVAVAFIVVMYVLIAISILKHEQTMPQHFRFRKDVSPGPHSFAHAAEYENRKKIAARRYSAGDQEVDTNKNDIGVIRLKQSVVATNGECLAIVTSTKDNLLNTKLNYNTLSAPRSMVNFTSVSYDLKPDLAHGHSITSNGSALSCTTQVSHTSQNSPAPVNDNSVANTKTKTKSKLYTSRQASTRRTALLMFMISLAFVISYTPHLILMICRLVDNSFEDNLTDTQRAVYKFFLRSYFVNFAINPVIYCLCGTKFRSYCKDLLCGKCKPDSSLG